MDNINVGTRSECLAYHTVILLADRLFVFLFYCDLGRGKGGVVVLLQLGVTTVLIWIILLLVYVICVFRITCHRLLGLLWTKF